MMFRFAHPQLLALLAAVAGWVVFALWRKPPSLGHPGTSTLIRIAGGAGRLRGRGPLLLRALCLALLVLAAARPQYYNVSRETKTSGVDIVLCLDTSGHDARHGLQNRRRRRGSPHGGEKSGEGLHRQARAGQDRTGDLRRRGVYPVPADPRQGPAAQPGGQAGGRHGRRQDGDRRRHRRRRQAAEGHQGQVPHPRPAHRRTAQRRRHHAAAGGGRRSAPWASRSMRSASGGRGRRRSGSTPCSVRAWRTRRSTSTRRR